MLLSYRSCAQVKLQICGRSCLESWSRFQMTQTNQELQMDSGMKNLQKWQKIALSTRYSPDNSRNNWCSSIYLFNSFEWMPVKILLFKVSSSTIHMFLPHLSAHFSLCCPLCSPEWTKALSRLSLPPSWSRSVEIEITFCEIHNFPIR